MSWQHFSLPPSAVPLLPGLHLSGSPAAGRLLVRDLVGRRRRLRTSWQESRRIFQHAHLPSLDFSGEFPCPGNCFLLEVVAKAEVSEHLKKCVVPRRPPHVLHIISSNTLLCRCRTGNPPGHLAQEDGLELQHSSNSQQNRWVFRDERR
eukprot:TRINITY_DN6945_c0_g1_i2.p1 TRINITY_DN6945_c0_g1~~TRINITY_DN6945_c0_g1_i2.p1  ORF type:complete len:149 (-),score=12.43 TRINITY_DN6945_c0_g1_i2:20-466(-)